MLVAAIAVLSLPLLGFGLLLARPALDMVWEHHPSHFWLVLLSAILSAVLAYATGATALRRADPRVLLVSLAFLCAAGFLALHALATPGVLLATPNAGFTAATPVGLAVGSAFAAASSVELTGERAVRVVRAGRLLRAGLLALLGLWAVASLAQIPPLHRDPAPEQASGAMLVLALVGVVLYGVAAARYAMLWWRRPSLMLLSMLSAFVLFAEALVAVVFARNWHLSWWEWHVLMLTAFGLVALGARIQWHEERFADLYSPDTLAGTWEISVLFADLQGFTTFSERHDATEVNAMLNAYFGVTVPTVVDRFGGEVDRLIGDAVMVTFNRRRDQPDHVRRAAAAGLALQESAAQVATQHAEWPRFRVGINTGPATVGVLGTRGGRTHTVVGDTVNVAARIEGKAPAGAVAIGPRTRAALPDAVTESLGELALKGKQQPIEVHLLRRLGGG